MKKLIFLVVCLLSGGMPVFSQTYQELCDRAITYTEQDSLPQAEDYIRRALKLEPANPHNALLFSNLGTIQRRQRQYEQALESYNFALNIAPRAVPILLNRAAIYMELGRNNLAQADYSLVLDLEKNNEEALLMRAYIYMQQREYKMAKADYERLLKVNPASYNGRLGLATLEQKEGKHEDALCGSRRSGEGPETHGYGIGRLGRGNKAGQFAAGYISDARRDLPCPKEKRPCQT